MALLTPNRMEKIIILLCINHLLFQASSGVQIGYCDCHENWARCNAGLGETKNGCGFFRHRSSSSSSLQLEQQQSCVQQCASSPFNGNSSWKPLYQASVKQITQFENECSHDPTKKWGKMKTGNEGPFAIAFAGGLRNFVATWHSWESNLIEPTISSHHSNKNMFHTYFHVWYDEKMKKNSAITQRGIELAKSLPYTKGYVHEKYSEFLTLLNKDEPNFNFQTNTNNSWFWPIHEEMKLNHSLKAPYTFGAGYSQFRKVYLVLQLVRKSNIDYSLIIRARPDHMLITSINLIQLAYDYSLRKSVINARGHYLIIPERHQGQRLSDHFAIGTSDAMYAYGSKPLPYTTACCEGFVHKNLEMRCFYRNEVIYNEEFTSMDKVLEPSKNMIFCSLPK